VTPDQAVQVLGSIYLLFIFAIPHYNKYLQSVCKYSLSLPSNIKG